MPLCTGKAESPISHHQEAVRQLYAQGETDEFIKPMIFPETDLDKDRVRDGDGVIFCNFRADRARQLSDAFLQPSFPTHSIEALGQKSSTSR